MTEQAPPDLAKKLTIDANFVSSQEQEETFHQNDLIQLHPFGVSLGTESDRPFLLLKNSTQELVLPVALNPLEAGLAIAQGNTSMLATTPHKFAVELLKSLNIKAVQCVFVQLKGPHQFVRIYLSGHPKTNSLKLRADEAMSFCMHTGIPLYATKEFIRRSKVMASEIEDLGKDLKKIPNLSLSKKQSYLM